MGGYCANCGVALVEGSRFCHQCGVPLSDRAPRGAAGIALRIARWAGAAAAAAYVVAWAAAFGDPEVSAIVGLAAVAAGLLQIVTGLGGGVGLSLGLGIGHVGIYALLMLLVNVFDWSPGEASEPFVLIGGAYLLYAVPATIVLFRRKVAPASPWVCVTCGYLLVGLTEPRCPECGTAFDPQRMAGLPEPFDRDGRS